MRRENWAVMGSTAATTMFVALALFWSFGAIADAPKQPTPTIQWPKLSAPDYDVTLRTSKASYVAGEAPVVELDVVNKTSKPISVSAQVRMMSEGLNSRVSRMRSMPTTEWETSRAITVGGQQTETLTVSIEKTISSGKTTYFTVKVGNQSISTQPFAVPLPMKQPAPKIQQ